jgi:hypothetical protein
MKRNALTGIFPQEGGILTLWFCGMVIGLFFLIDRNALLAGLLYLTGSLFFFASVETVKDFIKLRRGVRESSTYLLVPPVLGILTWGFVAFAHALIILILFVATLAFVSTRVIQGRERDWQTRVAFTAAVLFMALLGLFVSGVRFDAQLVFVVFVVPFTFFSAQELFVQHMADNRRLTNKALVSSGFQRGVQSRTAVLYFFIFAFAAASAVTLSFAPSPAFPLLFELFLMSFPIIWFTSGQELSFRRLGLEQASLDAVMTLMIIIFSSASLK